GARRFVGGGGSRFSGGGGGGEFFSFFLSGGKNKTRLCPPSPPPPIATRPTSGAVGAPNHLADSAIPVLSENRLPRCRRSRWPHLVPVSANISACLRSCEDRRKRPLNPVPGYRRRLEPTSHLVKLDGLGGR